MHTIEICIAMIWKCAVDSGSGLRGWRYWSPFDSEESATPLFFFSWHWIRKQRKTTIKDRKDISDPIMSRMMKKCKGMQKIGNDWKWNGFFGMMYKKYRMNHRRICLCKTQSMLLITLDSFIYRLSIDISQSNRTLINQWKLVLNALIFLYV